MRPGPIPFLPWWKTWMKRKIKAACGWESYVRPGFDVGEQKVGSTLSEGRVQCDTPWLCDSDRYGWQGEDITYHITEPIFWCPRECHGWRPNRLLFFAVYFGDGLTVRKTLLIFHAADEREETNKNRMRLSPIEQSFHKLCGAALMW